MNLELNNAQAGENRLLGPTHQRNEYNPVFNDWKTKTVPLHFKNRPHAF